MQIYETQKFIAFFLDIKIVFPILFKDINKDSFIN